MDNTNDSMFQVSVKGVFFNEENKVLMIKEKIGVWELPGGRIQKGEKFIECLQRECIEATGLVCEVLESQPFIVYSTVDEDERGRIMVFYKVKFSSLDFTPSDECVEIQFFTKDEIKQLLLPPQVKPFPDFL